MPDPNPGMLRMAEVNENLGNRYLDMSDKQNAYLRERQDRLDVLNERVANQQMAISDETLKQARDAKEYFDNTFKQTEQSLVAESMQESTPAFYEQFAGQAGSQAERQAAISRTAMNDELLGMGVNPNSGKYISSNRALALEDSANKSAAMTGAYTQARDTGWGKRMQVTNLGRGLPSQSLAAYSTSLGAGSSASGIATSGNNTAASTLGTGLQWAGAANSAYGNASAGYNNIYQGQLQSAQIQQSADNALMGAIGTGVGMWAGGGFKMSK